MMTKYKILRLDEEEALKAIEEYANEAIVHELTTLLKNNSTQHYWPGIIKHRIKELQNDKSNSKC